MRKRKSSTEGREEDEYSERPAKRLRRDPPSVCKDEPKELWPKEWLLEEKEARRRYNEALDIPTPPLWPDLLANVDLSKSSPLKPPKR